MRHFIDARRPIGTIVTAEGRNLQVPVVCKVDIVETTEANHRKVVTTNIDRTECFDCLDIVHPQVGSREWLAEKGRSY